MPNYRQRRMLAGATLAAVLVGAGIWFAFHWNSAADNSATNQRPSNPRVARQPPPSPTIRSSRYRNTTSAAAYVGSAACIECHREQHASFAASPHSRALGPVNLKDEPPDATWLHEKSGRKYDVARKDGRMWHRETVPDAKRGEILLGDYPVSYTIGSGNHSRSYLLDFGGYLVESPLTWYASKKAWKLSPGYDLHVHPGFSRAAHEGCVHCHAGRVESVGGGTHRLKFHEQKIGCESCHGPGSLHIKQPEREFAIVQPDKLPRALNEAICARCHLRDETFVMVPGRHRNDFRPGLPLTDFRIDFRTEQPTTSMKVVGHFEQMHQSRCYTQSRTMTCTTCHNPHLTPSASQKTDYYRKKCLSCHAADDGCKLEEQKRLAKQDNCVACHMPRSGTDIPHFAFTHHRIGTKHAARYEDPDPARVTQLIPFGDVSRLPPLDRERCLGLAYLQFSVKARQLAQEVYVARAFYHLQRVYDAGIRDAAVLGAFAELYWREKSDKCLEFAEAALKAADCSPVTRVHSLIVLGDFRFQRGNYNAAASAFQKLTTIRRWDADWQMLGNCRQRENDHEGAVRAFQQAVAIRRDRPELHELLARACEQTGRLKLARKHRDLADRLRSHQSRVRRIP